jgi:hypothetical protein
VSPRSESKEVSLGADWLPSGSTSLLAEIKVARRQLTLQADHTDPGAKKLVDMVTRDAAAIAGLADKLGTLDPQRPADLAVYERTDDDPYECIANAQPVNVDLVMIGGDVAYGRTDLVTTVVGDQAAAGYESQLAWASRCCWTTATRRIPAPRRCPGSASCGPRSSTPIHRSARSTPDRPRPCRPTTSPPSARTIRATVRFPVGHPQSRFGTTNGNPGRREIRLA